METKVNNLIDGYKRGDITLSTLIKKAEVLATEASSSNEVDVVMKAIVDSGLAGCSKRACKLEDTILANWLVLRAIERGYVTKWSQQ